MHIEIPAEISLDGFLQNIDNIGSHHRYMVLETVLADELHEGLEVIDLRNSDTAIHSVRIGCDLTLAEICLDLTEGIVSRNAEESEVAGSSLAIYGTEGVDLTECTSEHTERTELEIILHEALGCITAVCTYAAVAILGKVIVPVKKRRGFLGSE